MQCISLILVLIFETAFGGSIGSMKGLQRDTITSAMWDGVVAYIAVDRQAVQDKLDEFYNIEINGQRAPRLYMPSNPVFKLQPEQHVIYVEFGFVSSLDLGGEPAISSQGSESAIIIPFLSDSPDGAPKYALALGSLYQRDRGDVSKLNIAFPYFDIDEISVTDTGVVWRNGSDELRASFVKSNPCRPASKDNRHKFEVAIDEELDFSFAQPDLEYCDRQSIVNRPVCKKLRDVSCGLDDGVGPNICQFYQPPWEESCETSIDSVTISEGFRDLLLLSGEDPVNVVASEGLYGEYEVGLKYPCIE